MPTGSFNVGRDVTLTIFTSDGGILGTVGLTGFSSKPLTAEIKDVRITGLMYPAYLPEGWEGTLEFTRVDSGLDDYFAAAEDNYYAGGDLGTVRLTETITNVDQTISQYTYTQVAIKLDTAGDWKGNAKVEMKVAFIAGRRRKTV